MMITTGLTVQADAAAPTMLPAKTVATATQPASPKTTLEALAASQKAGTFLAVIFFDQKDKLFTTMDDTLSKFVKGSSEKVGVFHAAVKDKAEAQIIAKHKIERAKLPLLLVFAPNGAITGGFEQKVTDAQLNKSLVSPLVANIIKAVREQKVVVVTLQNAKTTFNIEAAKVAEELANDEQLKGHVEILQGDPANSKNQEFLAQCGVEKPVAKAAMVLLAPPSGTIMGVFPGDTVTKNALVDALTPKRSPCCPSGGTCK
jgi:hypothetical protein